MKFLLVLIFFLFLSPSVLAEIYFMPKNNFKMPINSIFANHISELKFNSIVDRVYYSYKDLVKKQNGYLQFDRLWNDDTVNASVNRHGRVWLVTMYGGLARHPLITEDAFMLVTCQEFGHHLGGFPIKGGMQDFWASSEGEADYFSAIKCLRRIFNNDDNINIVKNMVIDNFLSKKCNENYQNEVEIALCERIGMAALSVAHLLSTLGSDGGISFNTPDLSIAQKSNSNHLKAQCRLDTYLAADLCQKEFTEEISLKDPSVGVCEKSDGHDIGMRPPCWYHPPKRE